MCCTYWLNWEWFICSSFSSSNSTVRKVLTFWGRSTALILLQLDPMLSSSDLNLVGWSIYGFDLKGISYFSLICYVDNDKRNARWIWDPFAINKFTAGRDMDQNTLGYQNYWYFYWTSIHHQHIVNVINIIDTNGIAHTHIIIINY